MTLRIRGWLAAGCLIWACRGEAAGPEGGWAWPERLQPAAPCHRWRQSLVRPAPRPRQPLQVSKSFAAASGVSNEPICPTVVSQ